MPDYAALADTALRLLGDAGRTLTATRQGLGTYDPVVGSGETPSPAATTWDIVAAVFPATLARFKGIDNKLASDKNIVLTKARYLLVAGLKPDGDAAPEFLPEDRIAFDSKTWRVVGATPFSPAGTILYFQVGVVLAS